MTIEIWKTIPGMPYEASNLGRIKRTEPAQGAKVGHILKGTFDRNGYIYLDLHGPHYYFHELVASAFLGPKPIGCQVDHENCDPRDNRPDNLRYVTKAQNQMNSISRIGSSKFKGVSKIKEAKSKKWRAYITLSKKQKHLGTFETETQAAKAYNEAAKELFGEYAKLNEINPDRIHDV